jgi:hypothetical protein
MKVVGLEGLTMQEYANLQSTGMLHEWYPEATGRYSDDCQAKLVEMVEPAALDTQVQGTHYKDMKHQPLEQVYDDMGYVAFQGACVCKILKYTKRDKEGVDKLIDYEKAIHVLNCLIQKTKEERLK